MTRHRASRRSGMNETRARRPPPPIHNGTAYWIKLSAQQDSSFAVTNARNGFSNACKAWPLNTEEF